MLITPALAKQKQEDYCKFEANLYNIVNSRTARGTVLGSSLAAVIKNKLTKTT